MTGRISLILGLTISGVTSFAMPTTAAADEEANRIVPGELLVDPPTVENLGFRWYIDGDANRNAAVQVAYRAAATDAWHDALPMLRVHHEVANQDDEPFRTGNLFAGRVLSLACPGGSR